MARFHIHCAAASQADSLFKNITQAKFFFNLNSLICLINLDVSGFVFWSCS